MESIKTRDTEAMLSPNEYLFMADANGQVQVVTGPVKKSIDSANELLVFDDDTKQFKRVSTVSQAIRRMPAVDETSYVVLHNPAKDDATKFPNLASTTNSIQLDYGKRINIQGPCSFPLWPGQIANVITGHTLRTNQYLIVRVYNELEAKKNWGKAVIQKVGTEPSTNPNTEAKDQKAQDSLMPDNLANGQLFVIKGTSVSFYIPPTGLEVVPDVKGNFVRDAVTLENLEYCILKNEGGVKRYIAGPAVVYPEPDETFEEKSGTRIFRGIELNENMGIYVKVTSAYENYSTGEELFITGKETKIYMPRPEHAIIKYGDQDFIHYAVAVPEGEGRYVLDKRTGSINLVNGPKMLLPDPRHEVIVRRILTESQCMLWYPGNREVKDFNLGMMAAEEAKTIGMSGAMGNVDAFMYSDENLERERGLTFSTSNAFRKESRSYSKAHDLISDAMSRNQKFTKPRTITMTDSKYEGAVKIGVWPGYAVQIIDSKGNREVVLGPITKLLNHNDTLEVLTLSTGTPKSDKSPLKTVYLQTKHNKISDVITAVTKDMVEVRIYVSYKVDFQEEKSKNWFDVPDYVKLLTDHCRSLVINIIKQKTIEEVNTEYINIIRDTILGKNTDGNRKGRSFDNGMIITDVDVQEIDIQDEVIAELIEETQQSSVKHSLEVIKSTKAAETAKKIEASKREILDEEQATKLLQLENDNTYEASRLAGILSGVKKDLEIVQAQNAVTKIEAESEEIEKGVDVKIEAERSKIRTTEVVEQFKAIQPDLVQALITAGKMDLARELAKAIPGSRTSLHDILNVGTMAVLKNAVKGTPLEEALDSLGTDGKNGTLTKQ